MTYSKPQLTSFLAVATIQSVNNKVTSLNEAGPMPTQPAYEADE